MYCLACPPNGKTNLSGNFSMVRGWIGVFQIWIFPLYLRVLYIGLGCKITKGIVEHASLELGHPLHIKHEWKTTQKNQLFVGTFRKKWRQKIKLWNCQIEALQSRKRSSKSSPQFLDTPKVHFTKAKQSK